jgi:hypothetical protein
MMQIQKRKQQLGAVVVATVSALALAGCSLAPTGVTTSQGAALTGSVHGGQQPVVGATIQLYAAGKTGYGSAARPMISSTVTTDSTGSFKISGTYTCQSGDYVYLVATGGNPGTSSGNNSALAEMVGLGPCSALTPLTFISVNELTTVASVWALAPFMTGVTNVGTTASNSLGLANAFAAINKIVLTSNGTMPGPALPSGATLPTAEINTLADVLAACVNTVDATSPAAQSSTCQTIFSTVAGGTTPTNTIQAALNLAHNPTLGLSTLTGLVSSQSPFQPILSGAPTTWTIAINYTGGGLSSPSAIATDTSGAVWLANPGNGSVTKLDTTGNALSGSSGFTAGSLNVPTGIAIDAAGNAWIANKGNNTVTKLNSSGLTGSVYSGGGLNAPNAVAIDAGGNVWVTNGGSTSVTELSSSGTAISGSSGFAVGGTPTAIAIDPK